MAAGDTQITIAGNLVDDPELRFTPAGQPVAKFRIASTPRFRDNASGEWKDGDSLFLTCNVWRQAAENVAESLTRGMRVIVSGRLRQRSYETKEGEKRTVYEVEVDDVGPSLRNASAKVNKIARNGSGGGPNGPGGQGGQGARAVRPAGRRSGPGGRRQCRSVGVRRSRRLHRRTSLLTAWSGPADTGPAPAAGRTRHVARAARSPYSAAPASGPSLGGCERLPAARPGPARGAPVAGQRAARAPSAAPAGCRRRGASALGRRPHLGRGHGL